MTQMSEKIKSFLCEIKTDSSLLEKVTDDTNLIEDIGMDSLQLINFLLKIEDEFGVEFDFEKFDMNILKQFKGFCAYVEAMQEA